jgi:hypothetical protein
MVCGDLFHRADQHSQPINLEDQGRIRYQVEVQGRITYQLEKIYSHRNTHSLLIHEDGTSLEAMRTRSASTLRRRRDRSITRTAT